MMPGNTGNRSALHYKGGEVGTHLPRSVCDLNLARPVHLAVIDGVKNAVGGEGVWNSTFQVAEDHVLLAGKNPVATDSVAAFLMGDDPEAERLPLPDGIRVCDNYLELLHQRGVGTNQMREIEIVGDGAGLVTSVPSGEIAWAPHGFELFQNHPNPFNPSTSITFHLPVAERVTIRLYNLAGQELETLVDARFAAGRHELQWTARNLASGVYVYRMQAGRFTGAKRMAYLR
jgi:hypothetical protein